MKLDIVSIPLEDGALAGLHYIPEGNTRQVGLVFAHGFTSGKYSMDHLAGYLALHGFEGLSFDFEGHKLGGSARTLGSMQQAAGNLRSALHWLRAYRKLERIILIGHSMGAAAALHTAAEEYSSRDKAPDGLGALGGIVCLCMGDDPAGGFESPLGQAMLKQREDYVAGAPARQLLSELKDLLMAAPRIGAIPALFIAAKQDILIPVSHVETLAARVPNGSVQIVDSSHLEAPDKSRAMIYQWLRTTF